MKQERVYNGIQYYSQFQYRLLMAIVACALFFSSCNKDNLLGDLELLPAPEGYIRMAVNLTVSESEQVKTRATSAEEKAFDDAHVWVLVFNTDADPKLMQHPVKATKAGSQLYAMLRATSEARRLYVVTGLSTTMNDYLAAVSNFAEGTTLYSAISDALLTAVVGGEGVPIGGGSYIPMCSPVIECATGTVGLTEISKTVQRIAAKIEVDAQEVATDFTLAGATLWNGAKQGAVLPASSMRLSQGANVQRYSEKTVVASNSIRSQIYLYENKGTEADDATANPTIVIVRGSYKGISGYYRLDILHTTGAKPYASHSITRNFLYTLKIKKVDTVGYATAAEAAANTASNNISYNIEVSDGVSYDIASNGEYYLGLSNSECLIYVPTSTTDTTVDVATIAHNAPSTVVQGRISFANVEGSTPTVVSNPFNTLYTGGIHTGNLMLNLATDFVSCDVVLTLGNLTKSIKLVRNIEILSFGGSFSLGKGYVSGVISTPQEWVKISTTESNDVETGGDAIAPESDQEVYVILDHNLATDASAEDRSVGLFLSQVGDKGRKKVVLTQSKYDIISSGGTNVVKYSYVGTFHRHDEVGERVISINIPNGAYMVQVVSGQNFIRVAPGVNGTGSADPNLLTDNHGDAEHYPVADGKTQLVGRNTTNQLLFRVGMKDKIASTEVRYGLILITHSGGVNRLLVRQGEAADYVMRPMDPIGGSSDITRGDRPDAVKLTAFNLTDPQGRVGRVDLGNRQGDFTKYPSEGGYFFHAFQPYAWYPTGNAVNWVGAASIDPNWESCPDGYRRIKDGVDYNTGWVLDSEMRQSLWYYPKNGGAKSDYENSIRGLLADGSFDRKEKVDISHFDYSGVSAGDGATIGYLGIIIFNPNNFASIFIPAAGIRYFSGGLLRDQGAAAAWWSSTISNVSSAAWYGTMDSPISANGNFTFDNYTTRYTQGCSVRCVVDE